MSKKEDTPEVLEDDGPPTPKKKRAQRNELSKLEKEKHRKQKYRSEWENNKDFKGWLKPVKDNPFKGKCIICNVSFVSELSCIKKHCSSINHIKSLKCTSSYSQNIMLNFQSMAKPNPLDNAVKTAEIKLSALLAEHNVAFLLIDHLVPLLKDIFPDSKICQEMKLKRTKATNIITKVIAPVEKELLSQKLNNSKFSIMIDESTDVACTSTMCVVVRFFDTNSKIIVTRFWDLVQVFDPKEPEQVDKGATSESLFNKCIQSFKDYKVDVQNIVGFGSDGCSTMMGSKNSVSSRLTTTFPGIFIMKCICHSLHLCCSEACKSLPRRIEDFARNIFNFFTHSSKRQSQFTVFQNFLNISIHKLLHPSQTRWLSLFAVVQRILEQWNALQLYFNEKWLAEQLVAAENIHKQLNDPFTKMYFFFLEWVLPKFSTLNQYFQTESVVLNNLNEKMELVYKELLLCYMKRDYILQTPLTTLNPADKSKFINPSEVYLGVKVLNHIKTPDIIKRPDLIKEFISRCVDFLMVSCVQINKRYDFSNPILSLLNLLTPKVALSSKTRIEYPSILCLTQLLPRMVNQEKIQLIDDQWRTLTLVALPENIKLENEPDKFWSLILDLESGQFRELATFALNAFCLPHSNASCERVFSKINCIKTKSRNRLVVKTVASTVTASECIKKENGNCITFKPTKNMIDSMTSSTLYPINKTDVDLINTVEDFILEDIV